MRLRPTLLTAALAASLLAAVPARAADTVFVGFGVSAGTHLPTGAACTVEVFAGADGVAVLEAAKAQLCIVDYQTVSTSFGTFVDCIDFVCGQTAVVDGQPQGGTYWNMYENGVSAWYGVDDFNAESGDQLVFAYQTWTN